MEKITKINEFKEEIDARLENISLDISDSLLSKIQDIVLKAYEEKDIDTLEEFSGGINDMLIADGRDLDFLGSVFEEGQLSTSDIEDLLLDFNYFTDCELDSRFIFMHEVTLHSFAIEMLDEDINNSYITQELANMIDLNLYCRDLEHQGYTETSFGVLYTY